ncbi:hypothetical protein AWENTII_011848 [Aspergillus wentii]|nr:hypothetical protein MW887_008394 [Aspergillus wentii]
MSFYDSSRDVYISVENGRTTLHARCLTPDGYYKDSSIDLDDHLGNGDGRFEQGGSNFTQSAQGVKLDFYNNDPLLTAELCRYGGRYDYATFHINRVISNENGVLTWN